MVARNPDVKSSMLESFQPRLKPDGQLKSKSLTLKFVSTSDTTLATPDLLPVVTDAPCDTDTAFFDLREYWRSLESRSLGQVVFYTDVITTTMTVFDGLLFSIPEGVGTIAIAGRQTGGKGRGGNAWLSPMGCAMFTLPLSLSLQSRLGQRVSLLQHMVGLAVVRGILKVPGYQHLNLRLKWPNDIYFGKEMKIGGVLVTSTTLGGNIYATIGCGVNVDNSNPTVCINDVIRRHNLANPDLPDLEPLTPAQVIGRTVTELERLMDIFEAEGHEKFCQLYCDLWLHGGVRVKVRLENAVAESEGTIQGLDEYGFLSIRTDDKQTISVQPDGNSFDMMHNLVHFKTR